LRSQLRFKKNPIEKSETLLNIEALNSSHIESQIDAITLAEVIERTRESLPEHIRTSFDLSRLENRTYEEIAKIKGITVKSAEYHISVALKHFREKLARFINVIVIFFHFFSGYFTN